jgi:hypothetical protein
VAAAVVFSQAFIEQEEHRRFDTLTDSKQLTANQRDRFFELLVNSPEVEIGIGFGDVPEIDEINILCATHRSMNRCLHHLAALPEYALVDGLRAMSPRRWDKNLAGGSGGWVSDPDTKTRVTTAFGIFAQAEGEPIKRVFHAQIKATGDPAAAIFENPELVETLRRRLDQAERHFASGAHKRQLKRVGEVESSLSAPPPTNGAAKE